MILTSKHIGYSKIGKKMYSRNRIDLIKKKNGTFYMYHSFDGENGYSGRWYDTDMILNINETKKKLYYSIPLYENYDTGRLNKNVKVVIVFTDAGWKMLCEKKII